MAANNDDQDLVSQRLVITVMIALVHPRPVLVSSTMHLRQIEKQIESITRALLGGAGPEDNIVKCSPDLSWPYLESLILKCSHSALILRRVDQLSQAAQLHLGYTLMQPNSTVRQMLDSSAIIFTTKASVEKLHPFLRRQILLKQDIDFVDDESVMVELPDIKSQVDIWNTMHQIRESIAEVTIIPELLRYIQDILVFIRTHRLSRVGLSTQASEDFILLVRTLCVVQGHSFATPVTIRLAAKLALPVHVRLCAAEDEPSLQYGGDINTVKAWIKEWDVDVLVDSVLEEVPVPR